MSSESPLKGIKAVYFDLDDTLCAYWDAAKAGIRASFEIHPIPGHSTDEAIAAWSKEFRRFADELKTSHWYEIYLTQGGATRTELMRQALEAMGIVDPELAWRLSDTYARERNSRLELFAEAQNVLRGLHGAFPLGLITNGPADVQRQEIATLGIGGYFTHVFIEGEMGLGKPHPAVMRKAEIAVKLPPDEIVFVGNSYAHDIAPAIAAGWRTVWVTRESDVPPSAGKEARRETIPEGKPLPDAEIHDLSQLFSLLAVPTPNR